MKTNNLITITASLIVIIMCLIQSCTAGKELVASKPGAQLWGENCARCHVTPSPVDYNDNEWTTIGLHMQVRASLTRQEVNKIVEFLQSAN